MGPPCQAPTPIGLTSPGPHNRRSEAHADPRRDPIARPHPLDSAAPTRSATGRLVILVCGPPGAGKSTWARAIGEREGLRVLDRDEPEWSSERAFTAALRDVGRDPAARAVVIRTAATLSARRKAAALVTASEVVVLAVPADECVRRVTARKRDPATLRTQVAAVADWWARHEPGDVTARDAPPLVTSRRWT